MLYLLHGKDDGPRAIKEQYKSISIDLFTVTPHRRQDEATRTELNQCTVGTQSTSTDIFAFKLNKEVRWNSYNIILVIYIDQIQKRSWDPESIVIFSLRLCV
jgi:hypothetical protein